MKAEAASPMIISDNPHISFASSILSAVSSTQSHSVPEVRLHSKLAPLPTAPAVTYILSCRARIDIVMGFRKQGFPKASYGYASVTSSFSRGDDDDNHHPDTSSRPRSRHYLRPTMITDPTSTRRGHPLARRLLGTTIAAL
jgi:hypothetical protein